jgi:hypothetical protein
MNAHNFISLIGRKFGRLTVQKQGSHSPMGRVRWQCLCKCGKRVLVFSSALRSRHTISCGCFRRETTRQTHRTHGKRRTVEYAIWTSLRGRCLNPHNPAFISYGGRGIAVQWKSFEVFLRDMGPRPSPQHTIERDDNDGPYSKQNCRWATRREQANNRRNTPRVQYHGESMPLSEAARRSGLSYGGAYRRMRENKPITEHTPRQR